MKDSNDWRLTNQEQYFKGAVLIWRQYAPAHSDNDHDHCEFCFAKFMVSRAEPDALSHGYSTPDRCRWVCKPCFDDFASQFAFRVEHEN